MYYPKISSTYLHNVKLKNNSLLENTSGVKVRTEGRRLKSLLVELSPDLELEEFLNSFKQSIESGEAEVGIVGENGEEIDYAIYPDRIIEIPVIRSEK